MSNGNQQSDLDQEINEAALRYHAEPIPGKISVTLTKPARTQRDLALAYSPGVAAPVRRIASEPQDAYRYTSKGNLVAVITDGTAVLGLGNVGALAGKPVMEGKGVLFKRFADIDVFDIEVNSEDPDEFIRTCELISPTFGGINLEDIKAPECFDIEHRLCERMNIPVFHDDQHGTAIITTAGLMNVLELTGKKVEEIKIVVNGAGAAGISCAKMYKRLGVKNIVMCDSKGVLTTARTDLNKYKIPFAIDSDAKTLDDVIENADMFLGLSVAGALSKEMVAKMAPEPIIIALANPVPEIFPSEVKDVRDDAIIGTGRSDFPNQINNVLGFPFIFRGALDVRAKKITEGMKMAAAEALAALAKEPVPDYVKAAYHNDHIVYGKDHIIPLPFNKEALIWVASAVAKTAFEEGVAQVECYDHKKYQEQLRCIIYGRSENK